MNRLLMLLGSRSVFRDTCEPGSGAAIASRRSYSVVVGGVERTVEAP
jgi:hypothetical protein